MEALFPYQKSGATWLASKKWALLADDMGLGKSCQAVTAADETLAKRILVICPASARVNWQREFEMWSIFSPEFKVCFSSEDLPSDRTICSFNYATENVKRLTEEVWDLVIVDEAHMVKSSDAQRTRAVYGKSGIVRKTKKLWALSGTPAPNNNSELWVLLYTFGITKLCYEEFIKKYCEIYWANGRIYIRGNKRSADQEMREMLSKIMLRRLKEEVMTELPPIFYSDLFVEPGLVDLETTTFAEYVFPRDHRAELEKQLASDRSLLKANIERVRFSGNGMKVLEGIAQSVSTLRKYTGIQKIAPIAELVTEELKAKKYSKIVLFGIHTDVIEGLRVKLRDFNPVTIYGKTDPKKRQKNVDKFQNDPRCQVFIGNIMAAGTAITLTSSNQVLFVEQSWSPADNAQAAMRCHRIGQNETVFVRFAGVADSIDQHISQTLKRKTKELTAVFNNRDEVSDDDFKPVGGTDV